MILIRLLPFFILVFTTASNAQILQKNTLHPLAKMKGIHKYDTSGEKMSYVDPEGNTWIAKNNPVNLVINEFVASKIYEFALGTNVSVGHLLVGDLQVGFAFKSNPDFSPYGIEGASSSGGDNFLGTLAKAKRQKKAISGFERAAYASMLAYDDDIEHGNNFGKIETGNELIITRYDFDDSLKFFDCFEITQVYLAPDIVEKFKRNGVLEYVRSQLKCTYRKPSTEWIRGKLQGHTLSVDKIVATHQHVSSHKDELISAIAKAYQEVEENFSESEILSAYDFSQLRKVAAQHKIEIDSSVPAAQQLAAFTIAIINRRLADMDKIYLAGKTEL